MKIPGIAFFVLLFVTVGCSKKKEIAPPDPVKLKAAGLSVFEIQKRIAADQLRRAIEKQFKDDSIYVSDLKITASADGTVIVTGEVADPMMKRSAERSLKLVPGMGSYINSLHHGHGRRRLW